MKPALLVGVVLIILGIAGLAFGGFSFTHKEKVIDLGPIQASADKGVASDSADPRRARHRRRRGSGRIERPAGIAGAIPGRRRGA